MTLPSVAARSLRLSYTRVASVAAVATDLCGHPWPQPLILATVSPAGPESGHGQWPHAWPPHADRCTNGQMATRSVAMAATTLRARLAVGWPTT